MESTSELMRKISQGDEQSFTLTFDRYYPVLCYYADKFIHDTDESRSLVQQVFVDLWMKRNKIVIRQSMKAYLYKAVENYALDYLKHKNVESKFLHKAQAETEAFDTNPIEEAELNARINSAINDLPEKCREIFMLCRFEELHYREIAKRLGISIKTVEMQMGIALKKLRSQLTEHQNILLLLFVSSKKNELQLQGNRSSCRHRLG